MKNIGEISIAATEGRISGILVTSIADQGQPQEVKHSDGHQAETGTDCPCEGRSAWMRRLPH